MQPGTYALDAKAVVQRRHLPLDGAYTLGLLTKPPSPEGAHAIELAAPGYLRPTLHFGLPVVEGGAVLSGVRASFGPIGNHLQEVAHAAVFDQDNNLIAYGLVARASGSCGPWEVAFEPGAVRVRF